MRRRTADLSYKERTRSAVEGVLEPWQLGYRDPREGFHRLTNRIVSLRDELDREASYVERMFFPDSIDLTEDWVLYTIDRELSASDLYLSGEPLAHALAEADTVDDLISGTSDYTETVWSFSGLPEADAIYVGTLDDMHVLAGNMMIEVNAETGSPVSSGEVGPDTEVTETIYLDRFNPIHTIRAPLIRDTVTLTWSGETVPCDVQYAEDLTGTYREEFDYDGNGVIGRPEKVLMDSMKGQGVGSMDLFEWRKYAWLDQDGDGIVGDEDYAVVSVSHPSVAQDVYAYLEIPATYAGEFELGYTADIDRPVSLIRDGDDYREIRSSSILSDFPALAYDSLTGIYFAAEGSRIRAFTYSAELDQRTADTMIGIAFPADGWEIVGLDMHEGMLFALCRGGGSHRIYYGDVRAEFIEFLTAYITPSFNGFVPAAMAVSTDGYFVFEASGEVLVQRPYRDRFLEVNGRVYLNRRHDLRNVNGEAYTVIPHRIFNSMDAFAYGIGIERPWGVTNLALRNIINDFFENEQGHDAIGMSYGISRELGFDNEAVSYSGTPYALSNDLVWSGSLDVNGYLFTRGDDTARGYIVSGEIGSMEIVYGRYLIPDSTLREAYDELDIMGYFLDGNGDAVLCDEVVRIDRGTSLPEIRAFSLNDETALGDEGYIASGEPTDEFVALVSDIELKSPFTYRNMELNTMAPGQVRVSNDPFIPTIFGPSLSGELAAEDSELEFTP